MHVLEHEHFGGQFVVHLVFLPSASLHLWMGLRQKKIDLLGKLMMSQMSTIIYKSSVCSILHVFCMCGVSSANVGHVQVMKKIQPVCSATLLSAGGCQRQRCAGRTAGETMLHLGMLRIHGEQVVP